LGQLVVFPKAGA